jgi:hypothetical protein
MKKILLFCFILLLPCMAFSQSEMWKKLSDVQFKRKYFKEVDEYFLTPVFGNEVRELEGKEITVKGYVLPLETDETYIILSAYPFAACFFCGGAGPETVMEVYPIKPMKNFKPDQIATFRGILKLNANDIDHLNYILENAVKID